MLQGVDAEHQAERQHQHDHGDGGGAGIVVLLQFGNDHERRYFGFHRHVAGNENDRTVFSDRACECQRKACQQRGP